MYYWWHGSDLAGFFAEVQARGLKNVRIEFHPDEKEPARSMLHVREEVPKAEAMTNGGNGGYNFSHPCPPDCP